MHLNTRNPGEGSAGVAGIVKALGRVNDDCDNILSLRDYQAIRLESRFHLSLPLAKAIAELAYLGMGDRVGDAS